MDGVGEPDTEARQVGTRRVVDPRRTGSERPQDVGGDPNRSMAAPGRLLRWLTGEERDPPLAGDVDHATPAARRVVGQIRHVAPATTREGRASEDLDRRWRGEASVHAVVLQQDRAREPVAVREPGPLEDPGRGDGDHHVGDHRVALVEASEQQALRSGHGRLAPLGRDLFVVDAVERILAATL